MTIPAVMATAAKEILRSNALPPWRHHGLGQATPRSPGRIRRIAALTPFVIGARGRAWTRALQRPAPMKLSSPAPAGRPGGRGSRRAASRRPEFPAPCRRRSCRPPSRRSRFMPRTTRNRMKAMIAKFSVMVKKLPQASTAPCFLASTRFGACDGAGQGNEVVREVEPAGDRADDRHEQVADERLDDPPEGRADDHADREIDDVAAQGELLELLEHRAFSQRLSAFADRRASPIGMAGSTPGSCLSSP